MKTVKAFAGTKALKILYSSRQGKLHSIFKNSFNVEFGELLVGFVKDRRYAGLFNVAIDFDGDFIKLLEGLDGTSIHFYNNSLHFGELLVFRFYEIEEFDPWHYLKNRLGEKGTNKLIKDNINMFEGQIETLLEQLEHDVSVRMLVEKIKKYNFTNLSELIGLGPGLTPAGDDYISGHLLARSFINFNTATEIFLAQLRKMLYFVENNKSKTNDFSYHMLKTAAMLGGPKVGIDFLISLLQPGDSSQAERYFKSLLSLGVTSGIFLALGILKSIKEYMEVKPDIPDENG